MRKFVETDFLEQESPSILNNNRFKFLNLESQITSAKHWNTHDLPVLWLYNLHYFEGLQSCVTPQAYKYDLVVRWIAENPPRQGLGWDPYPLSLRIVNWIKWIWRSGDVEDQILKSLHQQADFLSKTIEYHLLGNHLLENARALVFAGVMFEGPVSDRWLRTGLDILDRQLNEQILKDGAHFELSPMYQGIMLELVLDVLVLSLNNNAPSELKGETKKYKSVAQSMASWLNTFVHPDGEISYFNDASIGVSHSPKRLLEQAVKIADWMPTQISCKNTMCESGLVRSERGESVLFFDLGEIGPSYLPGHGHADSLSLELSIFGQRIVVNTGVSEYGRSSRREYERGTHSHSTLTLDGSNSSETWGGFRVGRRAQVQNSACTESDDFVNLYGQHNGYRYLKGSPKHNRSIRHATNLLLVEDWVSSNKYNFECRYHLHPSVEIQIDEEGSKGTLKFAENRIINWSTNANSSSVEPFKYASEFGLLTKSNLLCLHGTGDERIYFKLQW